MSNKMNYNLQINNHKKKEFIDALHYSLDCLESNNYYDSVIHLDNETISWRAFTYGKTIYDFLIKIMKKMSDDNDNDWLLDNQEVNQKCDVELMMEGLFQTGEYSTAEATNNQDENIDIQNNNAFVSCYDNIENNNTLDCLNLSYDKEPALELLNMKKNESEVVVNNNNPVIDNDLENLDNKDIKVTDNFFTKLTRDAEKIIVYHNSRPNNEEDIEEFSPLPCSIDENNEDPWTKLNSNCFVKIKSDDVERALEWIEENETNKLRDDYQQESSFTVDSDKLLKRKVCQNDKDPWIGSKRRCSLQSEPDEVDPLEWTKETETIENDYQQELDKSFEIKSDHLMNLKVVDEKNKDPWIKLRALCSVQLGLDDVERALEGIEGNKTDTEEDNWQQEPDTFKINSDGLMKLISYENEGPVWVNSKRRCSIQLEPDNIDPLDWAKETEAIENDYPQESDESFEIKSDNLKKLKVIDQKNEDPWIKLRAHCFVQLRPDDVKTAHEWIEKKEKMKEDYKQQFGTPGKNSDDLIIGDLVYVKCLEHKFNNNKLGDELIRLWARKAKQQINNKKPFNPNLAWISKFKKYYNITGDKSDLKVNYNSQVQRKKSKSSCHSNQNYSTESDDKKSVINKKYNDDYLYYSDNFNDQYDDDDDYYFQNYRSNKKIKKEKQDRKISNKLSKGHGYNLRNIKKEKII